MNPTPPQPLHPPARTDAVLAASGLPRAEALLLLVLVSGLRRERLIAGSTDPLAPRVAERFAALAARRRAGEPIAYLIGWREFYGRRFGVDPRVLIPRPETELLVDRALAWIDADGRYASGALSAVDLGTGSGVIAVTLALERPLLDVTATDRSAEALALAITNAKTLAARVRFVAGDWYDALAPDAEPAFDLIVSNPPYVARDDPHLREGDLRFEPRDALTDHGDGLGAAMRIVAGALAHLRPGGGLLIEHGHDQAAAVRALMNAEGFRDVATLRDLAGIERVTTGLAGSRTGAR